MSNELIAPLTGAAGALPALPALPAFDAAAPAAPGFSTWLGKEVGQLNQVLMAAETRLQGQAAGGTQNLHEVMIALEEARMSLQLAMQVRNKVLEAYQEMMRMQI